jgi:hypothetical protein
MSVCEGCVRTEWRVDGWPVYWCDRSNVWVAIHNPGYEKTIFVCPENIMPGHPLFDVVFWEKATSDTKWLASQLC